MTGELTAPNNSKQNPLLGADIPNWTMKQFVGGKLTAADLASDGRKALRDAGLRGDTRRLLRFAKLQE